MFTAFLNSFKRWNGVRLRGMHLTHIANCIRAFEDGRLFPDPEPSDRSYRYLEEVDDRIACEG